MIVDKCIVRRLNQGRGDRRRNGQGQEAKLKYTPGPGICAVLGTVG